MGLWHDIHAADMLLRAGTHEGAAAESKPVAHGIVSDHVHDLHATAYPDTDGVWYEIRTDAAVAQDLVGGDLDAAVAAMADSFGYAEATVREINPFLEDEDEGEWSDMGTCMGCGAYGKVGLVHYRFLTSEGGVSECGRYI